MPQISTAFQTRHASKYLQQLCKHFAHKVEARFDKNQGGVAFPFGACRMQADEQALRLQCVVADDRRTEEAIFVIEVHLSRFAWRENVDLLWRRADGTDVVKSDILRSKLSGRGRESGDREKKGQLE